MEIRSCRVQRLYEEYIGQMWPCTGHSRRQGQRTQINKHLNRSAQRKMKQSERDMSGMARRQSAPTAGL
jgi:hypothetical protein